MPRGHKPEGQDIDLGLAILCSKERRLPHGEHRTCVEIGVSAASATRRRRRVRRSSGRSKSRQARQRKAFKVGFKALEAFLSSPSANLLNYSALENDLRKLIRVCHPPRKLGKSPRPKQHH